MVAITIAHEQARDHGRWDPRLSCLRRIIGPTLGLYRQLIPEESSAHWLELA